MSVLRGFRILAVEQYGAAPFGTQLLASLGAEVIKIEQPGQGDVSRQVGPHFLPGLPASAQSLFFQSLNLGKKSLTLNLSHPEGRALFRQLAATSHGVVNNLRGDVPAKLGLTYDQLKDANPALVCTHISAYGREGARATWPGYDYLVQAEAGYFALTGEPGTPPARMGLSLVDYMTGVVMALGLVSGLLDAARTGRGGDIDTSLYDVALHNLNYVAAWYLNMGVDTARQARSAHPSLTPCQLYPTRDGWIYLMCNKEKFWRALCACIGRREWADDPRFANFARRAEHREVLTAMLDEVLRTRTTADWMEIFGGAVPAAPVLSVAQALEAPLARAGGCIRDVVLDDGGRMRVLASPIKTSREAVPLAAAPSMGADTESLLRSIGVGEEEQGRLRSLGVL